MPPCQKTLAPADYAAMSGGAVAVDAPRLGLGQAMPFELYVTLCFIIAGAIVAYRADK